MTFPVPDNNPDTVQIRDFTIKQKSVKFRVDDDIFEAYAILGLPLLQDLVQVSKTIGDMLREQKYDALFDLFDNVLFPDSAKRFRQRATSKGVEAIDVKRQLMPIFYYLMEEYGMRPTQPSSDSLTSSPNGTDGTTSTAGSSPTDSTSTSSTLLPSST